jgi:hypothetical protein
MNTSKKSIFKSEIAYINICSGSTLNQHNFNSKIVNAFYTTAEEKSIISFYNLHHPTSSNQAISMNSFNSFEEKNTHPVASLAVLSKSTRDVFYIDQFKPQIEEKTNDIIIENEEENVENPEQREETNEVGNRSSMNNQSNEGSQNSRLTSDMFRQYIEKLEKKNPYKEINTCGMRLSPCGKKILVGYSDEHLKFWNVFKHSKTNRNDLGLSLLSEWR